MRTAVRVTTLPLGAAMLLLLLLCHPASAHASVVRTEPASGASLPAAPRSITLWFSESVSKAFSTARIVGADGGLLGELQASSPHRSDRQVELPLPPLPTGSYGVVWRVLSLADGHTNNGVVVFSVGTASPTRDALAPSQASRPARTDVALRWLRLCLLASTTGALAVVAGTLGPARRRRPRAEVVGALLTARHRLLLVAAVCAPLALLVGVAEQLRRLASLGPQQAGLAGLGSLVTDTRWGQLWLAQQVALLALAPVAIAIRRARGAARPTGLVVAAAAVALVVGVGALEALDSHAAALEATRGRAELAAAVHVLASLTWLGSLPALLVTLGSSRAAGASRPEVARVCAAPFARLAATSVGLVALSGLFEAGLQVGPVSDLTSTDYGRTVLTKAALLLALAAFGLLNYRRLALTTVPTGPLRHGAPRSTIAVEAGLGAVVLAAAALLAGTAPPTAAHAQAAVPRAPTLSGSARDLLVSVSASPNAPGLNGFSVTATSSRRPALAPVDDVQLRLHGTAQPSTIALRQVDPGRFYGSATIGVAGITGATVDVWRRGERLSTTVAWRMEPPQPRAVARPDRQLGPYANGLALALLAVVLSTTGVRALARRRSRHAIAVTQSLDLELAGLEDHR